MSTLRFFNLSEPVVPLFRHLGSALVDQDSEVEFVVSRSSYRGGDDRLGEAVRGGKVILTRGPRRQFASKLGRALAMAFYWLGACRIILASPKPGVNVFLTQPPTFVGLAVRLAKLRKQACVIVVMDVHPDELVSFGVLQQGSVVNRVLSRLMQGAWLRADRIIVIGRCMQTRIEEKGVDPSRITVIPNWVDDKSIVPVERAGNMVRRSLDWNDDFVVMYGGNVGYAQEFKTLIDVASRISPDEGIRIVVVGEGSTARKVREGMEAARAGEYHPFLHQDFALGEVLSAADVHFISLRDECTGLGVPSKLYAALAAGRPIVFEGSDEGEVHRTVTEAGVGAAVSSGDAEALLVAIRRLAADRDEWRRLCERSRTLLDEKYAAPHGVRRYLEALEPWL